MINKDFKRSKHPAQLLACLRKNPAQLLACLQYSPYSTASLHTSTHSAQLPACVPRSESIELPAVIRTWSPSVPAYQRTWNPSVPAYRRTWNPSVPAYRRTWNPSVPAYRRTWNSSLLRMYALFAHCTCVPSGIDDFKTSERTQTVRSTDLNMRRRDLSPSVDSPYLDQDQILPSLDIQPKTCLSQMISFALYRQALPQIKDHGAQ